MPSAAYPLFRFLTVQAARLILPATSVADLRRLRRLMALGGGWAPLARGVRSYVTSTGGVPAEWMTPAAVASGAVLLFIHGGGWTLGLDPAHRVLSSHIARAAGLRTLSLDYRLAPEHPFPAALEDCLAAFALLQAQGNAASRIALAGDSAGANLALALVHALIMRALPLPAAIACLSGMFDLEGTGASFRAISDVQLNPDFALAMVGHYAPGRDLRNPLLSPLWGDLSGFPPLFIQAGACEMLLSDSTRLADRARAATVPVTLSIYPLMWHAWHVWAPHLPEAASAVREVGTFLNTATVPTVLATAGAQ